MKPFGVLNGVDRLYFLTAQNILGVCILVKPNGYPLETIESDEEGRYILANLKLTTEKLFVVNVYTPTDCRLQTPFLQKLTIF